MRIARLFQLAPQTSPFFAALVHMTTTHGSGEIAWETELYDTANFWSDTAPARLTVPPGITAVQVSGSLFKTTNDYVQMLSQLNNANYKGRIYNKSELNAGEQSSSGAGRSAVTEVVPGDYFDFHSSVSGLEAADTFWGAIESIDPNLARALVYLSSDFAIPTNAQTVVPNWDMEEYDTHGFHDLVTNPGRLTVPAGVTRVRLGLSYSRTSDDDRMLGSILKNGSLFPGTGYKGLDYAAASVAGLNIQSAILEVVPGDYFEARVFNQTSGASLDSAESWFSIQEVDSAVKVLLVSAASNTQSLTSNVAEDKEYDTVVIQDDESMFDIGAPTDLVVPSGVTMARLSGRVDGSSTTGAMQMRLRKNGDSFMGSATHATNATNTDFVSATSAWVPVVAGDVFTVEVHSSSPRTLPASANASWACLECR